MENKPVFRQLGFMFQPLFLIDDIVRYRMFMFCWQRKSWNVEGFEGPLFDVDDDEHYGNMSNLMTGDDYGSGVMYDLVAENTSSSLFFNYTAPQATGWLNSYGTFCTPSGASLGGLAPPPLEVKKLY